MTTEKLNIISGGGINPNELIFGSGTGGFSVNSIMLKSGMSPIMTLNDTQIGGSLNKVSDLFNNLVIPNWALSYNYNAYGGKHNKDNKIKHDYDNDDDDKDDDIITDDLHDKLLELVKERDTRTKKITRKQNKTDKKQHKTKKNMKNKK